MRVATWNPNGLSTKVNGKEKGEFVRSFRADLIALPHCGFETTNELAFSIGVEQNQAIVDERFKKGLTIGVYVNLGEIKREPLSLPPGYIAFRWLPGDSQEVRCLAIYSRWSPKPAGDNKGWVKWTWEALQSCGSWLSAGPSIVLGDLNATCHYDRPGAPSRGQYRWKLSDNEVDCTSIVGRLRGLGLQSSWHKYNQIKHGFEHQHTYKPAKTHIDYIFVSKEFIIKYSRTVERFSDHSAVVSDLRLMLGDPETP